MTVRYGQHYGTRRTSQRQPIPGEQQVENNAGGYVYAVDQWARLERFLILGTDGGTYYVREQPLTIDNARVVEACLAADGLRTVAAIAAVSDAGRAPKNDPAVFALAIAASARQHDARGTAAETIRKAALDQLSTVCRTPTHLFHFLQFCSGLRRWSRMLRRAVGQWYARWTPEQLAFELVKYQQRDGWTHRDALRLSHATLPETHQAALRWAVGAKTLEGRVVERRNQRVEADGASTESRSSHYAAAGSLPAIIAAFQEAKEADASRLVQLIREHGLTREMVPTGALNDAAVWDALLTRMPPEAMIRNLAKMTAVGLLQPMSAATTRVVAVLGSQERLRKARIHPMQVLSALRVYQRGHGEKGSLTWQPVGTIVDALDAAFYATFGNVAPTQQRLLLALDVSASMSSQIGGLALSCREAAAAMALVTANVEPQRLIVGFTAGGSDWNHCALTELAISPRQRLDDVVRYLNGLPFGGTDCALPMVYARSRGLDVDAFVVYTDSETWAGAIHPSQALRDYRASRGIAAKEVVVGMTAAQFTIADPADPLTLDVVGFDTATPQAISAFVGQAEATA